MCGWQVKLCDPLVTHGPYLSALEIHVGHYKVLYRFSFFTFNFLYTGCSESSCHQSYVYFGSSDDTCGVTSNIAPPAEKKMCRPLLWWDILLSYYYTFLLSHTDTSVYRCYWQRRRQSLLYTRLRRTLAVYSEKCVVSCVRCKPWVDRVVSTVHIRDIAVIKLNIAQRWIPADNAALGRLWLAFMTTVRADITPDVYWCFTSNLSVTTRFCCDTITLLS